MLAIDVAGFSKDPPLAVGQQLDVGDTIAADDLGAELAGSTPARRELGEAHLAHRVSLSGFIAAW